MAGPCSECMYLDKNKVVYSNVMRERKKYGCRKNRYIPFWVKDKKLLDDSICECYEGLEENATYSVQNGEISNEKEAEVKCTEEKEKCVYGENTKREDHPIPKTGQLPGQIDIFNLELWKI